MEEERKTTRTCMGGMPARRTARCNIVPTARSARTQVKAVVSNSAEKQHPARLCVSSSTSSSSRGGQRRDNQS
jgi:hypothetical protein